MSGELRSISDTLTLPGPPVLTDGGPMVPAGELEVQEIIKIQTLEPIFPRPHLGRGAARSDILSSSCLPDLDDGAGLDIFCL